MAAPAPLRADLEDLHRNGRLFPPNYLHESWIDYLYWDTELDRKPTFYRSDCDRVSAGRPKLLLRPPFGNHASRAQPRFFGAAPTEPVVSTSRERWSMSQESGAGSTDPGTMMGSSSPAIRSARLSSRARDASAAIDAASTATIDIALGRVSTIGSAARVRGWLVLRHLELHILKLLPGGLRIAAVVPEGIGAERNHRQRRATA